MPRPLYHRGKEPNCSVGLRTGLERSGKSRPYRNCVNFLPYSPSLSLPLSGPFVLIVLAFSSSVLHNTNIYAPAGFEPATLARELPQACALDRVSTGIR